ncbi:MAG: PilN domain-containing protein [Thermodesulfobacteriota bacterium]
MIRINLLPVRAARKKETIRQQLSVAGLSLLLLFIIFGGVYWNRSNRLSEINADISKKEGEVRQLRKKVGELAKIKKQQKLVMEKLAKVEQLESKRKGPVKLFQQVSQAIPKKAWIESLKETKGGISIAGFAATEEVVADFMRGLEKFPELGRVELDILKKAKRGGVEMFAFTIRLVKSRKKA